MNLSKNRNPGVTLKSQLSRRQIRPKWMRITLKIGKKDSPAIPPEVIPRFGRLSRFCDSAYLHKPSNESHTESAQRPRNLFKLGISHGKIQLSTGIH